MAKACRRKQSGRNGLGALEVDQFMALPSSDEEQEQLQREGRKKASRKRKRPSKVPPKTRASKQKEVEEELLSELEMEGQQSVEEDSEDIGVLEPRPPHVTSWKEREEVPSDSDSGAEEEEQELSEQESHQPKEDDGSGKRVTLRMVRQWVKSLEKSHSLRSLRLLTGALRAAILTNLSSQQDTVTPYQFIVQDSAVFNALVVACFEQLPATLQHHFPHTSPSSPSTKLCLPSSQGAWAKVRRTLKQYLSDVLALAEALQDADMQRAVLKHMHSMAPYFASYPKLLKPFIKCLVEKWSASEGHVQVLAFLALRKVTLFQSHPALHTLLKKAYMAFVRNCKFTSASSLPSIKFMSSSLVELLAMDPPTAYHHGFVYIRQLAVHLRAAITSGKKDSQQVVYNWQFVHCLNLWTQLLCQVKHTSLQPLVYPLVQIVLGALNLQPAAKYYPLRLHLVRLLLQLSANTNTYIPIATYLVEVIESYGVEVGGASLQSGKAPELSTLLRATKQQLNTRSFRTTIVNEAFLLMLQFFCEHAHYIGFPELAYPPIVRLRKVMKTTQYSWLRLQLKQLVEKVEEVSKHVERERASVTFSPVQHDLVTSWETQHKGKENSLTQFWSKFRQLHHAQAPERGEEGGADSDGEESEGESDSEGEAEDLVEDLQLDE